MTSIIDPSRPVDLDYVKECIDETLGTGMKGNIFLHAKDFRNIVGTDDPGVKFFKFNYNGNSFHIYAGSDTVGEEGEVMVLLTSDMITFPQGWLQEQTEGESI